MNRNASLPVVCREREAWLHRGNACISSLRDGAGVIVIRPVILHWWQVRSALRRRPHREECRKVSEAASTVNDEAALGRGVLAGWFQEYERSYANLKITLKTACAARQLESASNIGLVRSCEVNLLGA